MLRLSLFVFLLAVHKNAIICQDNEVEPPEPAVAVESNEIPSHNALDQLENLEIREQALFDKKEQVSEGKQEKLLDIQQRIDKVEAAIMERTANLRKIKNILENRKENVEEKFNDRLSRINERIKKIAARRLRQPKDQSLQIGQK